jgi:O-antigen ligase
MSADTSSRTLGPRVRNDHDVRGAMIRMVSILVAWTAGVLVARSPAAGLAIAALVLIGWYAWPRWLRTDVEYYAAGVLVLSVLLSVPRQVQLGGISLGGALSAFAVLAAALLLTHRPGWIGSALRSMWLLVAFLLWSWLSLRGSGGVEGLQNVVVTTGFIVIATLVYVRTIEDRGFPLRLERLFERTFWLLAVLGAASIAAYGPGQGFLVPQHGASRSLALLLLPMTTLGLARWRYGDRRHGPLIVAVSMALIALSLSRTAFVVGCVLFALSRFTPRSIGGVVRLLAGFGVAVALLWAAVTFVQPFHDRFYPTGGDLVDVGGIQISATGRTDLWSETFRMFRTDPWLGHGAGASERFLVDLGGADHPHNDYLRLLNDYGILGTALWAVGMLLVAVAIFRDWLRRDAARDPFARFQLWTLLTVAGFLATMITANPLVYLHVQAPLGLLVGASLAIASRASATATRPDAPVLAAAGGTAYASDADAQR